MVYIGPDGNVSDRKPFSISGFITGIFSGIYGVIALLLGSVTGNPNQIRRADPEPLNRRRGNRARGANIRNLKNLGCAEAKAGG